MYDQVLVCFAQLDGCLERRKPDPDPRLYKYCPSSYERRLTVVCFADDDLPVFIYAYLKMYPTSRKDILKNSGIPLPDHHYLQNCWDLTKAELKGVLRLWHRENGE